MKHFLAFDGGGSKLDTVVFNENLNIIARERSGGVNGNFYSEKLISDHIEASAAAALRLSGVELADGGIGMLVGKRDFAFSRLSELCSGNIELIPEFYGCQLSAALKTCGCVVISGTGSGAAIINGADNIAHIGGYGAVLGDDGSGYIIGQRGLRAAVRALEGWGEPTVLADMLAEYAKSRIRIEIVHFFHSSEVPIHLRVADFARCVGQAADSGDHAAREIITNAGKVLALQTVRLFENEKAASDLEISLCGGAWRVSHMLRDSFEKTLHKCGVDNSVSAPLLEPVAGGILHYLLRHDKLDDEHSIMTKLQQLKIN